MGLAQIVTITISCLAFAMGLLNFYLTNLKRSQKTLVVSPMIIPKNRAPLSEGIMFDLYFVNRGNRDLLVSSLYLRVEHADGHLVRHEGPFIVESGKIKHIEMGLPLTNDQTLWPQPIPTKLLPISFEILCLGKRGESLRTELSVGNVQLADPGGMKIIREPGIHSAVIGTSPPRLYFFRPLSLGRKGKSFKGRNTKLDKIGKGS